MIKIKDRKLVINITEKQRQKIVLINLVIGFIVIVLLTRKCFYNPDGYWHIHTGQWIIENKSIPRLDGFSWYGIEHNLTWLNHEWLFDILIFLVYKVGGLNLVMWTVAIFGGILYLLITWFLYIRNRNIFFSIIISSISLLGLQPYLQPRPQTISFCLLVIVCILLEKKKWYFVIPIMILEVNLHGGFWPLFIVVIAFYSFKEKPILIFLSILSVVINPYGLDMYLYTFKNQTSSVGTQYILESLKTRMAEGENLLVLISYVILIVATHNIKVKWQETLFVFAIGGLTFMAERHVAFAYILIIPILSPYILIKMNNILQRYGEKRNFKMYKNFIYLYTFEVIIILLLFLGIQNLNNVKIDNLVPKDVYPSEKAIQYIKDNNLNRLFNEYVTGGYLLFNNVPTLIDGRGDPFSDKFNKTTILKDYCETINFKIDYIKFLQDNNINYLLLSVKSSLSLVIQSNPRFEVIYQDDYFIIYKLLE